MNANGKLSEIANFSLAYMLFQRYYLKSNVRNIFQKIEKEKIYLSIIMISWRFDYIEVFENKTLRALFSFDRN